MNSSFDVSKILESIDFKGGEFRDIHGFSLTVHEIEVLEKNHIPYQNCKSLKEVVFEIENILQDMDIVDEDLEAISLSISERDYYQNTNQ